MDTPLRKVLRGLYPDQFTRRFQPARVPVSKLRKARALFSFRHAKRYAPWLALLLAVLFVALVLIYYNTFLSLQYDVEEAKAQIDTQLQRRRNIILSMNVMVIDYARHEKEIFTHAVDARREMIEPAKPEAPRQAAGFLPQLPIRAGDLDALLSRIFAVAERYPDLRLSENFQRFMDALVEVESKVAEQRMLYNQRANEMSTEVGKFPGFVFAKVYGFEAPPFFVPDAEVHQPPKVGQ